MVFLKIQTHIYPEKLNEFEQAMKHLIKDDDPTKNKCKKGFYKDWHNPNAFFYLEEWNSEEHLRAHMQTDTFKAFMGAMKVLGEVVSAEVVHASQIEDLMN